MKRVFIILCCVILVVTTMAVPVSASILSCESKLADFPPVITENQKQMFQLKKRLSKYDKQPNAIGYQNEDGTETVFIFGENVKYFDKDGELKDKDIGIVSADLNKRLTGYAYQMKSNDIQVYFAERLSQKTGIKVVYQDHEIEMMPETCLDNAPIVRKVDVRTTSDSGLGQDNVVQYDQTFDSTTHIRLKTKYSGIKQDIVLEQYTGTNRFSFVADFDDLTPVAKNRGVYLLDGDEIIMEIPPAYVEDAKGAFSMGNNIEVKKRSDGKYEVVIVVDDAFLKDSNTVYPVIVDPGLLIYYPDTMDASVSSIYPYDHFGNTHLNCVGADISDGIWRFYVKFDLSALSGIPYQNIISAYYECYDNSSRTDNSVVEAYLNFENWTETGITWNNKPNWNWEKLCAVNVNANDLSADGTSTYRFYITAAVMAWMQGLPNYGIGLKERTDSGWRAFSSKEGDANLPCLSVNYCSQSDEASGLGIQNGVEYYIKSKRSGKHLTNNGDYTEANVYQANFSGSNNQKWKLVDLDNGYYKIIPANSSTRCIDVYGGAESPSGNTNEANIQLYPYTGGVNQQWKVVRNWNGTYRFLSRMSNDARAFVVLGASGSSGANVILYDYSADYVYNDDWTLEPVTLGTADFYSFTNEGGYGIDTTPCMGQAVGFSNSIGFSGGERRNYHAQTAYIRMQTVGLWYFSGHGYFSSVSFNSNDGSGWISSSICASSEGNNSPYTINSLQPNAFNKLNLAVFSSCLTGENRGNSNMVGNVFNRGAHYVVAHTQYTNIGTDAEWMVYFLNALNNNMSIYDSLEQADQAMYDQYGQNATLNNMNQRHTLGDGSVVLKH